MTVKPNLPQIFSNPNTRVQHDIFFATGVMAANIVKIKIDAKCLVITNKRKQPPLCACTALTRSLTVVDEAKPHSLFAGDRACMDAGACIFLAATAARFSLRGRLVHFVCCKKINEKTISRQKKHSLIIFWANSWQWWHMHCHLFLQVWQMNIASPVDTHAFVEFASGPGHGIRSLVTMRQPIARFSIAVAHI